MMETISTKRRVLLVLCLSAAFVFMTTGLLEAQTSTIKNVIFMVPDGMGLSNVTAARTYKGGNAGDSLAFETLGYIGYQSTYSLDSTVTDSAAAGSAWACGDKFNNGAICCHDADGDGVCDGTRKNTDTLLELAVAAGKSTGLVATSTVTHATPAVWGAHVHSRYCESEIFRQFYTAAGVDVILGGGIGVNRGACALAPTDADDVQNMIDDAVNNFGYTYVADKTELDNAVAGSSEIIGLFSPSGVTGNMTPMYLRSEASTEPTLSEMTQAALDILSRNENGFFLMVEGSQIDWANHAVNVVYQIGETLAFDDAVQTVKDWMAEDSSRASETIVVVVPDHDTSGFCITGPYGSRSAAGDSAAQFVDPASGELVYDQDGNAVYAPNLTAGWTSGNHTARDVAYWSNYQGVAGPLDNTEFYNLLKAHIN